MLRGLYQPGTLAPVSIPADTEQSTALHGGRLVAKRLKAHGVTKLFTLSGGHLFSIYDGCREEGIDIVDVRHEQSAAFAAEGWAKATREPGVCALTAGPGRHQRHERHGLGAAERLAAAGARRPRPGDALGPGLAPGDRPRAVRRAGDQARAHRRDHRRHPRAWWTRRCGRPPRRPPGRPSSTSRSTRCSWRPRRTPTRRPPCPTRSSGPAADGGAIERAAELLRGAERPVVMAGTGPLLGARRAGAAGAVRGAPDPGVPERAGARLRARRPPDLLLARARHRAEGRRRGARDRRADGLPARLRRLVRRRDARSWWSAPRRPSGRTRARWRPSSTAAWRRRSTRCAGRRGGRPRPHGVDRPAARGREREARGRAGTSCTDDRAPLHPLRLYHELGQVLDRNAVVIGDGGDFVSYAGRVIDTYEPGCWMDPGPYGCLGAGPGLRAGGQARPSGPPGLPAARRRRLRLLGDGVRHAGAPRRARRRGDGQQRHLGAREAPDGVPLRLLGGGRAPAGLPLRPGGRGPRRARRARRAPEELRPALERAFASGKPALVNVLTDPEVVYPRKSNLA